MNQTDNFDLKIPQSKIYFLAVVAVAFFSVMFVTGVSAHNDAMAEIEMIEIEKEAYLGNEILGNRLELFSDEIKSKGVEIDPSEILMECASVSGREILAGITRIPMKRILYHAELADLVRAGISPEHAQILLLSHAHLADDFTNENLNVSLVAEADVFKIKGEVDRYTSTKSVQTIPLDVLENYKRVCQESTGVMQYGSLNALFIRK